MQIILLFLTNFTWACFWPWLLAMLLPLLLGIAIGYLIWARYKRMVDKVNRELAAEKEAHVKAHNEVTELKTEIASLKYQLDELQKDNRALRASINSLEGDKVMLRAQIEEMQDQSAGIAAGAAALPVEEDSSDEPSVDYGSVFASTDLRLIEGIDPSIEKVLRSAGIHTFADLASKTPAQLRAIMTDAGPEYEGLDTSSWVQQAKMADEGQWGDLILLQKAIGDDEVSKMQLFYAAKAGGDTDYADFSVLLSADNLQVIEGVGPKADDTLKKAGINNWSAVASKTPEELKEILLAESTGFRILKTDTWPRQAELAAAGKWEELVEYQRFLDAGRDDTGDFDTPSKVSMMVEKLRKSGIPASPKDDAISYAGVFEADNLQIVEGIGPKIDVLLKEAGIDSWSVLASKTPEEIKAVLDAAGSRYRMHNPASWPKQAKLAANGKWKELIIFQQFLDAGRENVGDKENPSKVAKMAMRILGFSNNPEDLTIVEGIGPKISDLLKAAGIRNWSDLAAAEVSRLEGILTDAGSRFKLANPSTWPRQAELAAAGKWGELKDYQDFLQGGKDPDA